MPPCMAQIAPPGILGFDWSDQALTLADAQNYYGQGFRFCIRYVSRTDDLQQYNQANQTPDLSSQEAQDILNAGLALMVVQHACNPDWTPTADLGSQYGSCAAQFAGEAGIIAGVNVFLDLEGIKAGTDPQAIVDYCNNWFDQVAAAGYEPGIYLGYDVWLSPDDLYAKLKFKHYWKAGGDVTDVGTRGYQMIQTIDGKFDSDVTQNDNLGGCVVWQINNPAVA
jgi:Domain of unknown function (DUF1906)